MLQNAVIDIAIGLMLMYLVLSLLCTSINEYIATIFKLRSNNLKSSIQDLIDHPDLLTHFYDHGLIDGQHDASGGHPSYFDSRTVASALIGALNPANPLPGYADVQTAVLALPPDSNIRGALLASLTEANGDMTRLRTSIATWFDNAMDRLSGSYKRDIKLISFAVGLIIAAGLNADSLRVGRALWSDPALRSQVTDVAGNYLKSCGNSCFENTDKQKGLENVKQAVDSSQQTLRPLPIGWPEPIPTDDKPAFFWWFVQKFGGVVVTGVALSLGAPFWFDLLSKFMKLRGSGSPPDKAVP
jgi:hypothetical protein